MMIIWKGGSERVSGPLLLCRERERASAGASLEAGGSRGGRDRK